MRRGERAAPTASSAGRNDAFLRNSLPRMKVRAFSAMGRGFAEVWFLGGSKGGSLDPPLYIPETPRIIYENICK